MTNREALSHVLTGLSSRPLTLQCLVSQFSSVVTPCADIAPCDGIAAVLVASDVLADARLTSIEIEPPRMPLWCSMVARTISLKSEEGRSGTTKKAIEKEKAGLEKRETYDFGTVRSYRDWLEDSSITEAIIGRVLVILGMKNSEFEATSRESECAMKARAVFQGSNVRT